MTTERETETPEVDACVKKYEPCSLLYQYQQVLAKARSLEIRLLAADAKLCANQESTGSMNESVWEFTRYSPSYSPNDGPYMEEDSLGNYLKLSDIKKTFHARVPKGYVLVPKEPTEGMVGAAMQRGAPFGVGALYKAMLAAAPKPDQPRPMLTVTDENGNKSVTYLDKPERDSVSRDTKE